MKTLRRFLPALVLLPGLMFLSVSPASAAEGGGQDTTAVAINTEDGASIFRLAFSVRRVADGVVDQTNAAYALASCTDCQTIALAFQVVLAFGDVDVAVPENRAVAYNEQCVECVTYASATQIVLGFDGPVRLTADGWRRLVALRRTLSSLEERAPTLTLTELNTEVQAAKAELVAILDQELVEVPAGPNDADEAGPEVTDSPTSTTTGSDASTSTTTSTGESSTTTSSTPTTTAPPSSTTTTTVEPSSTTTSTTAASSDMGLGSN